MSVMQTMHNSPRLAIIDGNTLASIGMKSLLASIMPNVDIDTFGSFRELQVNHPEQYFHYFVTMDILLMNHDFFLANRRKTIVMTTSSNPETYLDKFHTLCVNVPEHVLVKSLLALEQHAHPTGKSMPVSMNMPVSQKLLSDREIEVLVLIVKGYINKEIADKLNVSLSTIITHRRNITDKLGMKSISSLTIYAVMHGYVSVGEI